MRQIVQPLHDSLAAQRIRDPVHGLIVLGGGTTSTRTKQTESPGFLSTRGSFKGYAVFDSWAFLTSCIRARRTVVLRTPSGSITQRVASWRSFGVGRTKGRKTRNESEWYCCRRSCTTSGTVPSATSSNTRLAQRRAMKIGAWKSSRARLKSTKCYEVWTGRCLRTSRRF